ncbi:putative Glycosyltransferase family 4 protein [Candidatus Magnetomoraceae bacterium gMMP-1]
MNIGIIGSYPPPYGGQSIHIQQLQKYLNQQNKISCTILNTGSNQKIKETGIINFQNMFYLLLHLLKEQYQVIHVHVAGYQNYPKIIPVYLANIFRNKKWVITFHSGNTMIFEVNFIWRYLIKLMLKSADKIICVNKSIKKELVKEGINEHLCVVNSAFSLNTTQNFNQFHLDKKITYFFDKHNPVITSVGMFESVYGFDILLECCVKLKKYFSQIGIILIASGGTKRKNIYYKIKQLHLQDHVIIMEEISHEKCLEIIKESKIFVRPTLYDGDSISVREALSLGIPVVASRTKFRPPNVVLFDIEDQESMFQAIQQAINQEKDRNIFKNINNEVFLNKINLIYKTI